MDATPAPQTSLSPALVDVAAGRVARVALGAALLLPAVHLLDASTRNTSVFNDLNRLALLAAVLACAGVFALRRTGTAPASTVLRLGLVLEVVVAFALSLVETTADGAVAAVGGRSAVAIWILANAAAVPNLPRWTLVTALLAATAWPLAYAVNLAAGTAHADLWPYLPWMAVNYVAAGVAYAIETIRHDAVVVAADSTELGGYRLVTRIGEGGMGEVWKAAHRLLARAAAIKIVRPGMLAQVDRQADIAAARFRREANLIARLQSPHTVYLYDFGVAADGRFYYAMELLDGVSLQTLVQEFGPLPDARVVSVLSQVCQSLHEAHERGLVHRDLKPSNVMVCQVALEYDFAKVLDFGLAKSLVDVGGSNLTMVGMATGTPGYIAPENATGDGGLDRRADVYALGCVAYFLLTGTPVFEESNPGRLALLHVRQTPDLPSTRANRTVAPALEALVMQCLAKSPKQRPPTMADVAEALTRCGVEPWTNADARQWWDAHLPAGSRWRMPAHDDPQA